MTIKNDVALIGVHLTKVAAEEHARLINAKNVRIVTLYPDISFDTPLGAPAPQPLGYYCVPDQHDCSFCGQHVHELRKFG